MQSCVYVEEITTFKQQHTANARFIACNWIQLVDLLWSSVIHNQHPAGQ